VVPVCIAGFYRFTMPMFLVDRLFPFFLCFSGALLLSTVLLMKVRNLFVHIFIDSEAFEWMNSVLSFHFLLFLEQADKKH